MNRAEQVDDGVLDVSVRYGDAANLDEDEDSAGLAAGGKVRLRQGIELKNLLDQKTGVIFEPEVDSEPRLDNCSERNYFNELGEKFDQLQLSDDEDFDEIGDFESRAKKMTVIPIPGTDQEWVKKKLRSPGLALQGAVPTKATITIHYSLYLEGNDEPYDSSVLRGRPERYKLDDGHLLPGLEIAIKSMMKREKSDFLIQPEMAFGEMGCPPRVPQNAEIFARIELLDVVEEGLAESLLADETKRYTYEEAEKAVRLEHIQGNAFVQDGEWKLAARRYEAASKLLENLELRNEDDETQVNHVLMKLYLNRGLCYLKLQRPKSTCVVLQNALRLNQGGGKLSPEQVTSEVKALYRLARAKRLLGNNGEARRLLERAHRKKPGDTAIGRELIDLDKHMQKERDNERAMCERMFNGPDGLPASQSRESKDEEVDDDDIEDVYQELVCFKLDAERAEWLLPSSLSAGSIGVVRRLSDKLGLFCKRVERGPHIVQWKIVKQE